MISEYRDIVFKFNLESILFVHVTNFKCTAIAREITHVHVQSACAYFIPGID